MGLTRETVKKCFCQVIREGNFTGSVELADRVIERLEISSPDIEMQIQAAAAKALKIIALKNARRDTGHHEAVTLGIQGIKQ